MKTDRTTALGLAVVGLAAAILTFTTLWELALTVGFPTRWAWLLPITVDAAGVVAARIWWRQNLPYAKALTLACIALSVAGNGAQHAMVAYSVRPHWLVIWLVSAVPPAMLGAVVHLAQMVAQPDDVDTTTGPDHRGADQTSTPGSNEKTEPARMATVPSPVSNTPDTPMLEPLSRPVEDHGPVWTEGDFLDRAEEDGVEVLPVDQPVQIEPDINLPDLVRWADEEGVPSRNKVMARYNVGTNRANRLLAQLAQSPVSTR